MNVHFSICFRVAPTFPYRYFAIQVYKPVTCMCKGAAPHSRATTVFTRQPKVRD